MDIPVHLTVCAASGRPFLAPEIARMVCAAVEQTTAKMAFQLFGYCLMPDHLHMLVSPGQSETPVSDFLRRFKSFTTRQYQKATGNSRLWQYSARDRLVRRGEDILALATYIAGNPVRQGLVECWMDWPYARILVE